MKLLSRIEEIILLSIWKLGDDAYGITIRQEVVRATGKGWLLGAIYAPLSRLHKNGYVRTVIGPPTPERGGRSKIYYRLTSEGKRALAEIQKVNARLWQGVPKLEYKRSS